MRSAMTISKNTANGSTAKARKPRGRFSALAERKITFLARESQQYYRASGREFPWRTERDPYRLAVAEILLQKTRADSVVSTYFRLIEKYPNAHALASADTHDLARVLTPLGLSRKRSTSLVGMANVIVERGPGLFGDWRSIELLVPGLGAYAARAIACFALGEHVGIVDANVVRILRRVFRIRNKDHRAAVFQRYADAVVDRGNSAREVNFGLLDLGAKVCLPLPRCQQCLLAEHCAYAKRSGAVR
jgi:A/G-specific adenine glycosylase